SDIISVFTVIPAPEIYALSLHDALPISTIGDLAGLAAALARRDERLVKQDTFSAMWKRQSTRDGNVSPYGLGFSIGTVAGTELLDRKSTRLNSSHVKISYAVFCLKKKK